MKSLQINANFEYANLKKSNNSFFTTGYDFIMLVICSY